jgi:two-component system phosphate regulon sensor histidine kinase PhoR
VSKKQLVYIVALMSLALVGLVVLQFYWINNAIRLSEDRFKQEVMTALEHVAKKLEYYELNHNPLAQELFSAWTDLSASAQFFQSGGPLPAPSLPDSLGAPGLANRLKMGSEPLGERFFEPRSWVSDSLAQARSQEYQRYLKVMGRVQKLLKLEEHRQRSHLRIEQRVDQALLDTLLVHALRDRKIDMPYYHGVLITGAPYQLVLAKDTVAKSQVDLVKDINTGRNNYSVRLFADDEVAAPSYLYVYFPQKNRFILREMLTVLVSSIGFIALIIFCFVMAVSTILRQKKLSEITRDFINNMTHEFKTPISTISLATEMMQDPDMRSNEKLFNRYLNIIRDENQRLGSQVEKVLQIATLEKSDFKLNIQLVDVHEVVTKTIENIAIQIENRGGQIVTQLKADHPMVEADEVHLTNIVFNLLDNANKYSPEPPQIRLGTEDSKRGLVITIADRGQGIAKDTIAKIFDKFYRVPTGDVHDVKGFGLGLSYVKTMVDAHHGSISVKSELGRGTTFSILLPYKHHHEGNQNLAG